MPHYQVEQAAFLAGGDDRDDVRMAEGCRNPDSRRKRRRKRSSRANSDPSTLNGHPAASLGVLSQVDGAHRTLADQRLHAKAGKSRAGTEGGVHGSSQA
jgi:hypothetical protein